MKPILILLALGIAAATLFAIAGDEPELALRGFAIGQKVWVQAANGRPVNGVIAGKPLYERSTMSWYYPVKMLPAGTLATIAQEYIGVRSD